MTKARGKALEGALAMAMCFPSRKGGIGLRAKPCVFVRRVKLELKLSRKMHSFCAGDWK